MARVVASATVNQGNSSSSGSLRMSGFQNLHLCIPYFIYLRHGIVLLSNVSFCSYVIADLRHLASSELDKFAFKMT